MDNVRTDINIACRLLELYQIAGAVSANNLSNFKIYKSKIYGMQRVLSFDFRNKHYYVSDDYSLMDNPKFIKDVIEDIIPNLKGKPLENPIPQTDGAKYASGLDGTEYYLWESPLE